MTSLHDLIEDYLADARARGLSPKTLKDAYGYPLHKVFLPWCERHGLTEASQLDDRAMNRFTSDLLEHGGARGQLSRHSVQSYVRNVNLSSTGAAARARSATSGPTRRKCRSASSTC